MSNNYWSIVSKRRLTRRRALAITGAGVAGAAFLAACGDSGDSDSGNSTGTSTGPTSSTGTGGSTGAQSTGSGRNSLIYQPVDTTAQAVPGGVIKAFAPNDITHFDALLSNSASTVNQGSVFAYNRLLKFKPGIYPNTPDGTSEGEMAESWEVSPDGLTLTLRIRQGPGTKWDEREPTNGREMDIEDILFSYKKFAEVHPSGANVSNERNPSAPVTSIEASDDSTLIVKLARPDSTILGLLSVPDHLYIMPVESDGKFNPETEVRGNGPWLLEEYVPSSRFVWVKNPNYYVENRPFPDRLERPIVTEVAQRLAQFRAGNIMTDVVEQAQQEVIQLKADVPEANLWLPNDYPQSLSPSVWFGYEGNSPFKDQRVRQAFSMLIDRDAFGSGLYNTDMFEAAGLGLESRINTCITAGYGPYWLDPTSSEFGENSKYLQYNPEEAKALLTAAGYPDGVDTEVFFNLEGQYGPSYQVAVEIFTGMFADLGNNIRQTGMPYTEYLNGYYFGYRSGASTRGTGAETAPGYNGLSVQAERPYASAVNLMLAAWHSGGGTFHGLTPNGENAASGDPELERMIEAVQAEFDIDEQIEKTHEIIRYMTGMSYMIPRPVATPSYQIWSAAISNVGMKERWGGSLSRWAEEYIDFWVDQSKL